MLPCGPGSSVGTGRRQDDQRNVRFGRANPNLYLLVPESAKIAEPPMIVLLHGSGRDGRSLLETWESLAKKEGIVLVGPDALTREGWGIPEDGPDFLHELIEVLAYQLDIDKRRIYLFGHSAGAGHALVMALLESEYFAAVTIHAGALPDSALPLIERAPRKTPIAMWVGTADPLFPLKVVRATRDALKAHGFAPELTEIPGHTHWYYSSAGDINRRSGPSCSSTSSPESQSTERYTFPGECRQV